MEGTRGSLSLGFLAVLVLMAPGFADETSGKAKKGGPPPVKRALNQAFKGRIIKIDKKKVTLFYDFEDPAQLDDFEEARPPRLLDASQNRVKIQGGRLVIEGSSAIRHKMEGKNQLRAKFLARLSKQSNVGTVFTEPILSDFYVVLNLFDQRFYKNGGLILAACGLHEDEGADTNRALVNWRDIVRSDARKVAKVGTDVEIEVWKDGWKEYCRVGDVVGKGSSKGKCKKMVTYKFGLWVHDSRMTIDDLTITVELTDEFLDLNDLKAAVDEVWEDVASTGPLAGVKNVPPQVRSSIEQYAEGRGDAQSVAKILSSKGLPKKVREIAAKVLSQRRDPKCVPMVIDALYSKDKTARVLAIKVVKSVTGKTFGFKPGSSEKKRSAAIRKLNAHMNQNRSRYFE